MAVKAKEFRYAIGLDRRGRVTADGRSPLDLDPAWTPEHLLLAGLVRCTVQSLRFHAAREGVDLLASGSASLEVEQLDVDLDKRVAPILLTLQSSTL
jgi:uncharacterized OsmC-like protein